MEIFNANKKNEQFAGNDSVAGKVQGSFEGYSQNYAPTVHGRSANGHRRPRKAVRCEPVGGWPTIDMLPPEAKTLAIDGDAVGSVVYFLINGSEVIYVGSTGGIGSRLYQHRLAVRKDSSHNFDSVLYIVADSPADALRIEKVWIKKLNTRLNGCKESVHYTPDRRIPITVKLTEAERQIIAAAAKQDGRPVSAWIRHVAIQAAKQVKANK